MEQLFAAFGVDWRLLAAQAFNFALVLVALRLFLYKPVLAMLAKRQTLVAQSVEDAKRAADTAATADAAAAMRVQAADREAEGIVQSARVAAQSEKGTILAEAAERATALERDAQARATETAARTLRESEKEIARAAVLAAETILKKHHA